MKMNDEDKGLFYKQLKEDISDRANVSLEALRIYFEQSDEENYFTDAFACAGDHSYYKEIANLYKPAKDPVGVVFSFIFETSYIDTTNEQLADETGLDIWIDNWLEDQEEELQDTFHLLPYEERLNILQYHDFADSLPEGTKAFGIKYVVDGYISSVHEKEKWIPKFMDTCYPAISKIETALRLKEELNQPGKADRLVSSIDQDAEAPTKKPRAARTKI